MELQDQLEFAEKRKQAFTVINLGKIGGPPLSKKKPEEEKKPVEEKKDGEEEKKDEEAKIQEQETP